MKLNVAGSKRRDLFLRVADMVKRFAHGQPGGHWDHNGDAYKLVQDAVTCVAYELGDVNQSEAAKIVGCDRKAFARKHTRFMEELAVWANKGKRTRRRAA